MTLFDFLEERDTLENCSKRRGLSAYKHWAIDMASMIRPSCCSHCPLYYECREAGDDISCEEFIAANIDELKF